MKTNAKNLMMALAAAATLTACSHDDLFDPSFVENNTKAQYADNFMKKYPNVDLSQSWDFSSHQPSFTLTTSTSGRARTRGAGGSWSREDWYEVEPATLDWMHGELVEAVDHRSIGKPFYMTVPGEDFYVVPIYQGLASAVWELHVVIDGDDQLVWGKSEDIEIKDLGYPDWHKVYEHAVTYEWDSVNGHTFEYMFNTDGSGKVMQDGRTNTVTDVRAKPRRFSGYRVGADMYFYLKVTKGDEGNCNTGAEQSSLNGQMLHLDCPRPTNIPAEYETMIVGCEDANLQNADYDMNDLVLLVYGRKVPKPIEITEGSTVVSENRIVRYMIEDLGATDDFDFNDIVIDMVEQTPMTPVYTNGVLTDWRRGATSQKAVVRHLGGTLPFVLTIGDTTLPTLGGQATFQTSPDQAFDVAGWDINRHNISVQVQQQAGQQGSGDILYNTVRFPRAGEAPMIIAVDPSQDWMPERQSVPETWFYTSEE